MSEVLDASNRWAYFLASPCRQRGTRAGLGQPIEHDDVSFVTRMVIRAKASTRRTVNARLEGSPSTSSPSAAPRWPGIVPPPP